MLGIVISISQSFSPVVFLLYLKLEIAGDTWEFSCPGEENSSELVSEKEE